MQVILKDGIYELDSPFNLTSAHSGKNGYKVIYKAENSGQVIISGGSVITGWTDANSDGIWEASVPSGSNSRQLYVDGNRATRARSIDDSGWSRNGSGGLYNSPSAAADWTNKTEIELVVQFLWKQYRGKVASISGTTTTMNSKYWNLAQIGPFGILDYRATHVSWVENAFELLDVVGEWYLNRTTHTLYYKPRPGESMTGSAAVSVVLPRLEKLIDGNGVSHVNFEGLQFSYATWLQPSTENGYVSIQSGSVLTDPNYATIEDAFEGIKEMPGNVQFVHSSNILFNGNTFKNLGGVTMLRTTPSHQMRRTKAIILQRRKRTTLFFTIRFIILPMALPMLAVFIIWARHQAAVF